MMKPPFKACTWFDMCIVWFVASLSCTNMTLKFLLCHAHSCDIRPRPWPVTSGS